jgi:hypothetical protein
MESYTIEDQLVNINLAKYRSKESGVINPYTFVVLTG